LLPCKRICPLGNLLKFTTSGIEAKKSAGELYPSCLLKTHYDYHNLVFIK
jgi:hypothetical protein